MFLRVFSALSLLVCWNMSVLLFQMIQDHTQEVSLILCTRQHLLYAEDTRNILSSCFNLYFTHLICFHIKTMSHYKLKTTITDLHIFDRYHHFDHNPHPDFSSARHFVFSEKERKGKIFCYLYFVHFGSVADPSEFWERFKIIFFAII